MPKGKRTQTTNRRNRTELTEEQRRLLMMEPEEIEREGFSNNETIRRIRELMKGIPLDLRRKWAEEWREEHRKSR